MPRDIAIIVSGSRDWEDVGAIRRRLVTYRDYGMVHVLHGDCRGADKIAAAEAADLGYVVHRYPANWKKGDSSAGPVRNRLMFGMLKVFHYQGWKVLGELFMLPHCRGTKDMKEILEQNNCAFMVTKGKV